MDRVQKPSNSECCTSSSEPFRFQLNSVPFAFEKAEATAKKQEVYFINMTVISFIIILLLNKFSVIPLKTFFMKSHVVQVVES
jgi:hypothetical protein